MNKKESFTGENTELQNLAYKYYKENTEYLYLKYAVNEWKDEVDNSKDVTLVLGSSYSRNAIDPGCFGNMLNCSVGGEDLYYSGLLYDKLRKGGVNIKTLFLFLGYYGLFQELRKEVNCRDVIEDILEPVIMDAPMNNALNSSVYSGHKEEIAELAYEIQKKKRYYYNDSNTRISHVLIKGGRWASYPDEEKVEEGRGRAYAHNKMEKYTESYETNIRLFDEFAGKLKDDGVRLVVVIPPFSEHYVRFISKTMKEGLLSFLKDRKTEYIDYNDIDLFDENDFVDMDHLNGRGAYKFSRHLSRTFGCV